ncbi:MAG: toxin [Candidatus Omnitrophica bacterium]|nr:toxin [Candidatus Omnitrophota bacterium]
MRQIRWSQLKSTRLKRTRGVSFEEIIDSKLLGIREHPSRKEQQILIYDHKGYVWEVPFIIDEYGIFLKTLYPSRKYYKLYKGGG